MKPLDQEQLRRWIQSIQSDAPPIPVSQKVCGPMAHPLPFWMRPWSWIAVSLAALMSLWWWMGAWWPQSAPGKRPAWAQAPSSLNVQIHIPHKRLRILWYHTPAPPRVAT